MNKAREDYIGLTIKNKTLMTTWNFNNLTNWRLNLLKIFHPLWVTQNQHIVISFRSLSFCSVNFRIWSMSWHPQKFPMQIFVQVFFFPFWDNILCALLNQWERVFKWQIVNKEIDFEKKRKLSFYSRNLFLQE